MYSLLDKTAKISYKINITYDFSDDIKHFLTYEEVLEFIIELYSRNVNSSFYVEKVISQTTINNYMIIGGSTKYEIIDNGELIKDLNRYKRTMKLKRILNGR